MVRNSTRTVNWAVEVASRMRGAAFPLDEDDARDRLKGIRADGQGIGEIMDRIRFPVATPAELLHEIGKRTGGPRGGGEGAWPVEVAKALRDVPFPLSKEGAKESLQGIEVRGKDISALLPRLKYPVETPAALLDQLAQNAE